MPIVGRKKRKHGSFHGDGPSRANPASAGCVDMVSKDGMEFVDVHGAIDKLGCVDRLPFVNVVWARDDL